MKLKFSFPTIGGGSLALWGQFLKFSHPLVVGLDIRISLRFLFATIHFLVGPSFGLHQAANTGLNWSLPVEVAGEVHQVAFQEHFVLIPRC